MTKTKTHAISPAIATIALIAVAIVAAAAVGPYVMNQSSILKQDLSVSIQGANLVQLRKGVGEWHLDVTLKNTGTFVITAVNVYMRQDNGIDLSIISPGISVSPGGSSTFATDSFTSQITPGTSYTIRVQVFSGNNSVTYTQIVAAEGL